MVRNVYSFNLSIDKVKPLVIKLPNLFEKIQNELEVFACFLETLGSE